MYTDYVYTATSQAALTSPTPGTVLAGPAVTFNWSASTGATDYALWMGTTRGTDNIYVSGPIAATSASVSTLPINGATVYARLFTIYAATRVYTDYIYTATTQAALTSPTPGSMLIGPTVTFNWSASAGATDYALWLGTTPGTDNLYVSGATIYARLFTIYASTRVYADYV